MYRSMKEVLPWVRRTVGPTTESQPRVLQMLREERHAPFKYGAQRRRPRDQCYGVRRPTGSRRHQLRALSVILLMSALAVASLQLPSVAAARGAVKFSSVGVLHRGLLARNSERSFACSNSFFAVSPCTTGVTTSYVNTTGNVTYWSVQNKDTREPNWFDLSCSVTAPVTSCSVQSQLMVPKNSTVNVPVTYATGGTAGTGSITFSARLGTTLSGTTTANVIAPPPPPPQYVMIVSPTSQALELDPSASTSIQFQLLNASGDTGTFQYTASCTGTGIASCTPGSGSIFLNPNAKSSVSIGLNAGATLGTSGTLTFVATSATNSTVRDSSRIDVAIGSGTPGTNILPFNQGSSVERGLCLTMALGQSAGSECGDLRLVHALPAIRTRNKVRAPVLLYNSRHAHPQPIVDAEVTLPNDGQIPQTVSAALRDAGGALLDSAQWVGSMWTAGSTRRLALSYDALGVQTGIVPYRLAVTRSYVGSTVRDSVNGELIIVNRSGSEIAPGWSVAGVERLYILSPNLLWVGGDGSARKYTPTSIANVWSAANVDRPDTIKLASGSYLRYLPHGLQVQFDGLGRHVATINRLQDTTTFSYASGSSFRLTSITVPKASFAKSYTFTYDSSSYGVRLRSVTAPPASGQSRVVQIGSDAGGRLASITDVDGSLITFGYDPSVANRISSRTDERGTVTTFSYDVASAVTGSTIALDGGQMITRTIQPVETRGVNGATAVSRSKAYTKFDGPRTDVGDSTLFWLDRFGAPTKIRDALGNETTLTRGDPNYPALVTRMQDARRRVVGAGYDARGNVISVTDSSTYDPIRTKYSTFTYAWDARWDFDTLTISPEGMRARSAFDVTNGNRLWQEDARGTSSRVTFDYYASGVAAGLARAIQTPDGGRDSLEYDASLANLSLQRTPLGNYSRYVTDDVGQVLQTISPIDAAGNTITSYSAVDRLGRDTLSLTYTSSGADTIRVRSHYDLAGNVDTVVRRASPDPNGLGALTTAFVYDRANRKVQETLVGFNTIQWTYDAVGNVLSGGRKPTDNTYDALNRVVSKFSNAGTSYFSYDAVGNVRTANNDAARITRAYNPNGTLKADTLRIATTRLSYFNVHTYGLRYGYDLEGRRTWMKHPTTVAPGVGLDSVGYGYDAQTGLPSQVRDVLGNSFTFRYDGSNRLTRTTRLAQLADSLVETRSYDLDSRLVRLGSDSLVYDVRGKIVSLGGDSVFSYTPLGALKYAFFRGWELGPETYVPDALANNVSSNMASTPRPSKYYSYEAGSGRLQRSVTPASGGLKPDTVSYFYYSDGTVGEQLQRRHFIAGDGAVEKRDNLYNYSSDMQLASNLMVFDTIPHQTNLSVVYTHKETYRYDALGRRVWQQIVRDTSCHNHDQASGCRNELTRTVWDGNQMLYEIRSIADTTQNPSQEQEGGLAPFFGIVGYTHGLDLDKPLAMFKSASNLVLPNVNWRGLYVSGTCPITACQQSQVYFPNAQANAYQDAPPTINGDPSWYGSLITGMRDGSGLLYRRNRYLDPQTGRFAQEDPIGLAGGLNLYGFAAGDPVNFSDPFGLCPPCNPGMTGMRPLANSSPWKGLAILSGITAGVAAAVAAPEIAAAASRWLLGGSSAAASIPTLTVGAVPRGREMLGQALQFLQEMPASARVEAFRNFAQQIESATQGAWQAAEQQALNATVFAGKAGEAIAINAQGEVFRGNIGNPEHFTRTAAGFIAHFDKLTTLVR